MAKVMTIKELKALIKEAEKDNATKFIIEADACYCEFGDYAEVSVSFETEDGHSVYYDEWENW